MLEFENRRLAGEVGEATALAAAAKEQRSRTQQHLLVEVEGRARIEEAHRAGSEALEGSKQHAQQTADALQVSSLFPAHLSFGRVFHSELI